MDDNQWGDRADEYIHLHIVRFSLSDIFDGVPHALLFSVRSLDVRKRAASQAGPGAVHPSICLLSTSDASDELSLALF